MEKYLFFLGSNPELSAREIVNVLKRHGFAPEIPEADLTYLLLSTDKAIDESLMDVLGGTERIARVLEIADKVFHVADLARQVTTWPKKFNVGFSGDGQDNKGWQAIAEEFKRVARAKGSRLRFVLPKGGKAMLNAAQVIFNKLDQAPNMELIMIKAGDKFVLARTLAVQDISAYERRDTSRPARDARIGMLPPKLAQIMLNLIPEAATKTPRVYDPFCGMGTILQEGWLMDWQMTGSDSNKEMVAASEKNLYWMTKNFKVANELKPEVFARDATRKSYGMAGKFDAIVTEPFLGAPLSAPLSVPQAKVRLTALSDIYLRFLQVNYDLLVANGFIVMVWPVIKTAGKPAGKWAMIPDSVIDEIKGSGYSWIQSLGIVGDEKFLTNRGSVIYARPDAIVGRELTVWKKMAN